MWVREEAHIAYEVGVHRQTVLESERFDRHLDGVGGRIPEGRFDLAAQFRAGERGGVDHQIGRTLHRGELPAFGRDPVYEGAVCGVGLQRMTSTDLLEAPDEHSIAGLEEQHTGLDGSRGQLVDDLPEITGEQTAAHIHDDGESLERWIGANREIDHRDDQLRRKIVGDEPPEVFECGGRGTHPGSGQSGDDDHLSATSGTVLTRSDGVSTQIRHCCDSARTSDTPTVPSLPTGVSPASGSDAGVESDGGFEAPFDVAPRSASCTVCAVARPTPGTAVISSTVASRSFATDPKCVTSACGACRPDRGSRRAPTPSSAANVCCGGR